MVINNIPLPRRLHKLNVFQVLFWFVFSISWVSCQM